MLIRHRRPGWVRLYILFIITFFDVLLSICIVIHWLLVIPGSTRTLWRRTGISSFVFLLTSVFSVVGMFFPVSVLRFYLRTRCFHHYYHYHRYHEVVKCFYIFIARSVSSFRTKINPLLLQTYLITFWFLSSFALFKRSNKFLVNSSLV